jgi:hypothetical protein
MISASGNLQDGFLRKKGYGRFRRQGEGETPLPLPMMSKKREKMPGEGLKGFMIHGPGKRKRRKD